MIRSATIDDAARLTGRWRSGGPMLIEEEAVREDGGVTLTRADADLAGLDYDYVAARITPRMGSALTDVGLTALFSRTPRTRGSAAT
jgi:hypothetical protein